MSKLTNKASVYLILAITGIAFVVYSINVENYILLVVAILFSAVSADNIFCNLRK